MCDAASHGLHDYRQLKMLDFLVVQPAVNMPCDVITVVIEHQHVPVASDPDIRQKTKIGAKISREFFIRCPRMTRIMLPRHDQNGTPTNGSGILHGEARATDTEPLVQYLGAFTNNAAYISLKRRLGKTRGIGPIIADKLRVDVESFAWIRIDRTASLLIEA